MSIVVDFPTTDVEPTPVNQPQRYLGYFTEEELREIWVDKKYRRFYMRIRSELEMIEQGQMTNRYKKKCAICKKVVLPGHGWLDRDMDDEEWVVIHKFGGCGEFEIINPSQEKRQIGWGGVLYVTAIALIGMMVIL